MNFQLASTSSPRNPVRLAILFLLTGLALPALAQQPARTLNDCRNVTDRTARFECYDQVESVPRVAPQGATLSTIPATRATPASESAPAAASSSQTAVVREVEKREPFYKRILPFGLGDDDKDEPATADATGAPVSEADSFGLSDTRSSDKDGNRELIDTIATLSEVEPNTWKVTLANGQVWQQVTGKRYAMKAGDQVVIRRSGWGGSYRLYVERLGSYIQVDRIN